MYDIVDIQYESEVFIYEETTKAMPNKFCTIYSEGRNA